MFRKLIAVVSFCLVPAIGWAGSNTGLVTGVFVHTPDIVMFRVGSTINNGPSCALSTKEWAISMSDPMGKGLLAVLLAAQSQGKNVLVQGYTNTCRDWGDRELPSYVVILD